MIIKEVNIQAFSGLKDKKISFNKGTNVIYGENEKGKSTVQAFIKSMLYGISSKKVKGETERKRYMPFDGSSIRGELSIIHKDKTYIIKRTFGNTKKEDVSVILDELTGEEVKYIDPIEPGKYFLGVNRSTFEKTLFISQLGVAVNKDKEEEIMDKITSLFGCGEDEVPAGRAIEKLEAIKKEFTTLRGVGRLDLLKKKYTELIEERYEGYKLSEQNLNWENELLIEKKLRKNLREEINKLEVYKKYLKKISLQKEYKEISDYLRKSEELKRKEAEIEKGLGKDFVDESFIDDLKEDNISYLNLLDSKEEIKNDIEKLKKILEEKNKLGEEYKFIDMFGDDIKDKLMSIKYEITSLEEKLNNYRRIKNDIAEEEKELESKRNLIKNAGALRELNDEIKDVLKDYENSLRELKYFIEKSNPEKDLDKKIKKENTNRLIFGLLLILGGSICIFKGIFLLIGITVSIVSVFMLYQKSILLNRLTDKLKDQEGVEKLTLKVNFIENKLKEYMVKVGVNDYAELMTLLKKWEVLNDYEDRALLRIDEKRRMVNEKELEETEKKYKKSIDMVTSLRNLSGGATLDEVIEKINIYNKLKSELEVINMDKDGKEENLNRVLKEIVVKENKLKAKLELMGLEEVNLLDIEVYIKEYKEKLKKHNEIHQGLMAIEDTYKVLLKDRNIDEIRMELKDVINEDMKYSYESEEEIESEVRKKSDELIECEKSIKDLENSINNRFIGKRNIIEIEEELAAVEGKIKSEEKKLKALELALGTLDESFTSIRREVGPAINSKILDNFKILTEDKYEDVKLGDNYEMMIRDCNNLFKGEYLSNGAYDQLYLSLRIAFIELLFNDDEYPLILDDAFVQYDDKRRENAIKLITKKTRGQSIIFTCQQIEEQILRDNKIDFEYICL